MAIRELWRLSAALSQNARAMFAKGQFDAWYIVRVAFF